MSTTTTTMASANGEQRVTQVVNVPLGGGHTARLVITIHMTSSRAPLPVNAAHQPNNQQPQLPRLVLRGPMQQNQANQPALPQQQQQQQQQQQRPVAVVRPWQPQPLDARHIVHQHRIERRSVGQRAGAPLEDLPLSSIRRRRLCSAAHHRTFCPRCHIRRRQVCRWWTRQQYRQL